MRLALSGTVGDLTQLELLDACACRFGVDGVVLDVARFPRRDGEYLAQIKKFAADLGLTLVAVRDDALFGAASDALRMAYELGAPYVLTRTPESGLDPVRAYNDALPFIAVAVAEAKRRNVTLAVRNVPGSLAADAFELARLRKEADSAWLRFALDAVALGGPPEEKIRKHVVLGYHLGEPADDVLHALDPFAGFLCLEAHPGQREEEGVKRLVRAWRTVLENAAHPHVPS
jgi:sugar phosphate isomerase/epimerase